MRARAGLLHSVADLDGCRLSKIGRSRKSGGLGGVEPTGSDWQRADDARQTAEAVTGHQPFGVTIRHRGLVTSTAVRMKIENPLAAGGPRVFHRCLGVFAEDAEVIADDGESLFRLCIFTAKACAYISPFG